MCGKSYQEIDVYLIAGQSNAAGYSWHDDKLTETFPHIWYAAETDNYRDGSYLGSSHIESFSEFVFGITQGLGTIPDRIGPEYGMAKVFSADYSKDNPALIFKSAAGGTALRDVSVPVLISDVIFILGWIGNRLSVETKCVRER